MWGLHVLLQGMKITYMRSERHRTAVVHASLCCAPLRGCKNGCIAGYGAQRSMLVKGGRSVQGSAGRPHDNNCCDGTSLYVMAAAVVLADTSDMHTHACCRR